MAADQKYKPTSAEILTALELERRKRGLRSYAELEATTDPQERQEIVRAYIAEKQAKTKKKEKQCKGCVYNVWSPDHSCRMCSFRKTERPRQKDADGNCLEYATEREKKRLVQSKFYRFTHEDWSGKTALEIAEALDTNVHHVYDMINLAKKRNGKIITYKRSAPGRKEKSSDG